MSDRLKMLQLLYPFFMTMLSTPPFFRKKFFENVKSILLYLLIYYLI